MLTLQFGQCGNQLGYELFAKVSADVRSANTGVSRGVNYEYTERTVEKWYDGITGRGQHHARAILVDTEEKVVSRVHRDANAFWVYRAGNVVCRSGGGSANNWAYGYGINGGGLATAVSDVARREIEKLDRFQGFLLLLSSAGGTGSGVGSRAVRDLRAQYGSKSVAAAIVLPFAFGEVCTQSYNTVLTLAEFSDAADLSILVENEQAHATCVNLLRNPNALLRDMNGVIAENLLAVLQPTSDASCNVNFLVSKVAAHPNFRFATIRSAPRAPEASLPYEPEHNWDVHVRHLKQTLRVPKSHAELRNAQLRTPNPLPSKAAVSHAYSPCVGNVLVTRGRSAENDVPTGDFRKEHLYPEWLTLDSFTHLHQERRFLNRDKFLALLTNNSEMHRPLDTYLEKAWNSYRCAAFLHQYKEYGMEEDDFLRAFAKVENMVQEYKSLRGHSGS